MKKCGVEGSSWGGGGVDGGGRGARGPRAGGAGTNLVTSGGCLGVSVTVDLSSRGGRGGTTLRRYTVSGGADWR